MDPNDVVSRYGPKQQAGVDPALKLDIEAQLKNKQYRGYTGPGGPAVAFKKQLLRAYSQGMRRKAELEGRPFDQNAVTQEFERALAAMQQANEKAAEKAAGGYNEDLAPGFKEAHQSKAFIDALESMAKTIVSPTFGLANPSQTQNNQAPAIPNAQNTPNPIRTESIENTSGTPDPAPSPTVNPQPTQDGAQQLQDQIQQAQSAGDFQLANMLIGQLNMLLSSRVSGTDPMQPVFQEAQRNLEQRRAGLESEADRAAGIYRRPEDVQAGRDIALAQQAASSRTRQELGGAAGAQAAALAGAQQAYKAGEAITPEAIRQARELRYRYEQEEVNRRNQAAEAAASANTARGDAVRSQQVYDEFLRHNQATRGIQAQAAARQQAADAPPSIGTAAKPVTPVQTQAGAQGQGANSATNAKKEVDVASQAGAGTQQQSQAGTQAFDINSIAPGNALSRENRDTVYRTANVADGPVRDALENYFDVLAHAPAGSNAPTQAIMAAIKANPNQIPLQLTEYLRTTSDARAKDIEDEDWREPVPMLSDEDMKILQDIHIKERWA